MHAGEARSVFVARSAPVLPVHIQDTTLLVTNAHWKARLSSVAREELSAATLLMSGGRGSRPFSLQNLEKLPHPALISPPPIAKKSTHHPLGGNLLLQMLSCVEGSSMHLINPLFMSSLSDR